MAKYQTYDACILYHALYQWHYLSLLGIPDFFIFIPLIDEIDEQLNVWWEDMSMNNHDIANVVFRVITNGFLENLMHFIYYLKRYYNRTIWSKITALSVGKNKTINYTTPFKNMSLIYDIATFIMFAIQERHTKARLIPGRIDRSFRKTVHAFMVGPITVNSRQSTRLKHLTD